MNQDKQKQLYTGKEVWVKNVRYELQKQLGTPSAIGEVWQAANRQGEAAVIKFLQPDILKQSRAGDETSRKIVDQFFSEGMVLNKLAARNPDAPHHFFPRLLREDRAADPPCLVLELAPGREITEILTDPPAEEEAAAIISQLARALQQLHKARLGAKDLQLKDLMWDRDAQKLMIIDWNVTDTSSSRTRRRDIIRSAFFFYRLLTWSEEADPYFKLSSELPDGEPLRNPRWAKISPIVQETLLRGLNRPGWTPCSEPDDWVEAMDTLLRRLQVKQPSKLWEEIKSLKRLYLHASAWRVAKLALKKAKGTKDEELYQEVVEGIEKDWKAEIRAKLKGAMAYWENNNFEKAEQEFERLLAQNETILSEEDKLNYRRYLLGARAARQDKEFYRQNKIALRGILENMEKKNYAKAREICIQQGFIVSTFQEAVKA